MKSPLLRFVLPGVAGYLVDTIVLYAVMAAGMGFLRGRLVSFACAVVAMWLVSRRFTLAEQPRATPRPLWSEFWYYLITIALGSFLNLATYWVVMAMVAVPPPAALPAFGVVLGSLVGVVANFASAGWWVSGKRDWFVLPAMRLPALSTSVCLIMVQAIFWMGQLHEADLPGLYMDGANPDYLAAPTLNPELDNPIYLMPTVLFPILGNLYHGVQSYYVGLPVFALLGFNMVALRIAQGLFGSGVLVLLQLVLQRATGSRWLALAGSIGLATELAFLASYRTQMGIVVSGCFWLLWAVYLAIAPASGERQKGDVSAAVTEPRAGNSKPSMAAWFWSGACAGLAVYSYFVFLFFVPAFVILGWWHTRNWRAVWIWSLGFALGMQTYVLGYLSLILSLGGLAPAVAWLRMATEQLEPMSGELGFIDNLANAWMLVGLALKNTANELMIFAEALPGSWAVWKMELWIVALLILAGSSLVKGFGPQRQPIDKKQELLAYWHIAWLPLMFVAVSLIFGSRLWGHHYTALVPMMYLVLFLTVYHIIKSLPFALPRWLWAGLALCLVFGNLRQQNTFFERLEATGGVGILSNAINRMAEDALSSPPELVHVFPEWGFMIPFIFLTANQRTYEIEMAPAILQRLANENRVLRLYYWKAEDSTKYRDSLRAEGFEVRATGTYTQRDQGTAFLWMEAVAGSGQN